MNEHHDNSTAQTAQASDQAEQSAQPHQEPTQSQGDRQQPDSQQPSSGNAPSHIAYTVTQNNGQDYWQKIGAVWEAKDDGLKLKMHSLPLNGEVVLRSREHLEQIRAAKA